MANHVTHTLTVAGPEAAVAEFRARHLVPVKGGTQFDFNTVIPMPACLIGLSAANNVALAVEALSRQARAERIVARRDPADAQAQMWRRMNETGRNAPGERALAAIEASGYPTWYEWSLAHWGTKWNSYNGELVREAAGVLTFRFQTAWTVPTPVLNRLATLYPDLKIVVDSYDECHNFAAHSVGSAGQFHEASFACTPTAFEAAYGAAITSAWPAPPGRPLQ